MSPLPSTCIYVSCAQSREIFVFALERHNASMRQLQQLKLDGKVMPMTISANGKYLYAALRDEPYRVASFAIAGDGTLSRLADAPLVESMAYLSCDRAGTTLLAASYPGDCISINPIGHDGVPLAPSQQIATPAHAHAIRLDRDERHALVASLGGNQMLSYAFDSAQQRLGETPLGSFKTPEGSGPRHFVFSRDQRRVFLLCELDCSLHCYAYDHASGRLSLLSRCEGLPGQALPTSAADIQLSPDEAFVYISERNASQLACFSIDMQSGALEPRYTHTTVSSPRSFVIDSSGNWLIVAGQEEPSLRLYARDPRSGAIEARADYPIGAMATWVCQLDLPN